jgi:hypothetical protein
MSKNCANENPKCPPSVSIYFRCMCTYIYAEWSPWLFLSRVLMRRYSLRRLLLGGLGMYVLYIIIILRSMKATTKNNSIVTNTLGCEWPILRGQRKVVKTNSTQKEQQQLSPSITLVILWTMFTLPSTKG